jgi:hypothetical protein
LGKSDAVAERACGIDFFEHQAAAEIYLTSCSKTSAGIFKPYAATSRMDFALSIFAFLSGVFKAFHRSLRLCAFSQKSGVFSKTLANKRAVSTVTQRFALQAVPE